LFQDFIAMPRLLIAAALLFALSSTTVHAAGDAVAGKVKAYTCTGCHGVPGYKNTYPTYNVPKLGGQSAEYLIAALDSYRSGEREHSTMNLQAESLSGSDVQDIAAYLSGLDSGAAAHSGGGPAAGREKSTPCQACHGENGMGVQAMYPNLGGQYESYLAKALADYRAGARVNPLMSGFAGALSDQDIADLAAWYASQSGLSDLSD